MYLYWRRYGISFLISPEIERAICRRRPCTMKDKFEQLTVLCILEVPRASSVLSKRDGSGEVFFSFPSHDDDPKQQKDAHSAVDAFLRAKGERGFFRVFKEYGPLRMFQEQLTLREVLRFQEYARMLRTDRLDLEFIRHCDELSRNPEAADDPLLALIQPPQLIPVWSQPFHVLGVCNDILEALGLTLMLHKSKGRSMRYCAREDCNEVFIREENSNKIYCCETCAKRVSDREYKKRKKRRGVALRSRDSKKSLSGTRKVRLIR
jgi:hypothetical protein